MTTGNPIKNAILPIPSPKKGKKAFAYSRNKCGYIAVEVTPETHATHPSMNPKYGPNAAQTQAEKPALPGNTELSSEVISA
jgi:hypothetical protein